MKWNAPLYASLASAPFRRLLWRAAALRCKRPAFTALSIVEKKVAAAALALSLLPAFSVSRTFLSWFFTAVRLRLLIAVRRRVWRARLAADLVLAMVGLELKKGRKTSGEAHRVKRFA